MKYIFSFSLFFSVLFSLNCLGQDTLSSNNSYWVNLKTQLQKRTEIVNDLTKLLSNPQKINKQLLDNLKKVNIDFNKYLDTLKIINTQTISIASSKNNRLVLSIMKVLIELEKNRTLTKNKKIIEFQGKLEGCENRIAMLKREYNDNCEKNQKSYLQFNPDQVREDKEIKF